ncbi:uncharacterized protein LOC135689017 [Rhopilema esculentum]|uniref:uncharacterized protein LOC135689017 n=1 Tax=Rhopilema esculentum TaxID=499914 RepID=UPI0031CEB05B
MVCCGPQNKKFLLASGKIYNMSSDERREEKDSDCDAFSEVLEYLPQCHSLTWADTESSETLPGASASLQHPSVFGPGQIPIQPREKDTHVSSVANKRKFTISEHIVRNVRARNVLTELYPRIRGVSLVEAAADLLTSREKAVFRKKLQESGMENENFRYKEICKLAAVSQRCFAQIMKIDEHFPIHFRFSPRRERG